MGTGSGDSKQTTAAACKVQAETSQDRSRRDKPRQGKARVKTNPTVEPSQKPSRSQGQNQHKARRFLPLQS